MVKGDRADYFGMSGYAPEQLKQMGYLVWLPLQPKGSFLGEGDNLHFLISSIMGYDPTRIRSGADGAVGCIQVLRPSHYSEPLHRLCLRTR